MKKINFNKALTILGSIAVVDGNNKPQFLHKELTLHLHSMNTGNSIKNESILLRLFEKGEAELDDSDLDFLEQNIKKCQTAPDYMIAMALAEITRVK